MARRLAIWLGGLVLVVGGTVALLSFATSGATVFRVDGGTRLHIEGPITGAATERFQRLLDQHPELAEVTLGDMPGTDDANWLLAIGYLIREAGMATRAVGTLQNDAILLFLAGRPRVLDGGALVVTSKAVARDLGLPFDRAEVARAERRGYVEAMLGDADYAVFVEETRGARDQVVLGDGEIARFGLVTAD